MNQEQTSCQDGTLPGASCVVPRLAVRAHRLRWFFEEHGLLRTLGKILAVLARNLLGPPRNKASALASPSRNAVLCETLDLQPGELVEVRSWAEIEQTLDPGSKAAGLLFMPEMRAFCGMQLRVRKQVHKIVIENGGGVRRLYHTVLLDNAICDGARVGCDRSCFFFWREAWLRRVEQQARPAADLSALEAENEIGRRTN